MRFIPVMGCEYGVDWVIRHLIEEALDPVELEVVYEDFIKGLYPENANIGWITVCTIDALKVLDPISWDLAVNEWVNSEVEDGNLVTFDSGNSYFWKSEIEEFLGE